MAIDELLIHNHDFLVAKIESPTGAYYVHADAHTVCAQTGTHIGTVATTSLEKYQRVPRSVN